MPDAVDLAAVLASTTATSTSAPARSTWCRAAPHQPVSADGAEVVLVEPSATVSTGDNPGELTAERRLA